MSDFKRLSRSVKGLTVLVTGAASGMGRATAAVFAADEFFYGRIWNEHTRAAYFIAVKKFLAWAEGRDLELRSITPRDVGNI